MRNLNRSSPERAQGVMAAVHRTLETFPEFHLLEPEILLGNDEAVYDWVAGNTMNGNFVHKGDLAPWGVMDLGGSSAEIAMAVNITSENHQSVQNVSVNGINYHLHIHSAQCYGNHC